VKVVSGIDTAWDSCVRTISAGGSVNRLAISHRGDLIGTGYFLGCQILDAASGSVVIAWKNSPGVYALAFSADDSFFAFSMGKGQIGLYDVQTGQIMWLDFKE
jgi:WD40 repeat protein